MKWKNDLGHPGPFNKVGFIFRKFWNTLQPLQRKTGLTRKIWFNFACFRETCASLLLPMVNLMNAVVYKEVNCVIDKRVGDRW